jgi:hypothetical protein
MPRALAIVILVLVALVFAYLVLEVLAYVGIIKNPAFLASGRPRDTGSLIARGWHWSHVLFLKTMVFCAFALTYSHLFDRIPLLNKFVVFRRPALATEEHMINRFASRTIARVVRRLPWIPDPYPLRGTPFIMLVSVLPAYLLNVMNGAVEGLSKELPEKVRPPLLVGILLGILSTILIVVLAVLAKKAPALVAGSNRAHAKRIIKCAIVSAAATIAYMFMFSQADAEDVPSLIEEALVNSIVLGGTLSVVCLHLTNADV